jgi:predicted phosphoribosyltransferase
MDRTALGNTLADRLKKLHGKDAVIVCLQESSLLTCLTMAGSLRAWVYPLLYAPAYTSDVTHQLLGAFDQEGEFCPLPDSPAANADVPAEITAAIDGQKEAAIKSLREQKARYGITFDEHRLDGRHVILAGDIVTSILPLVMAQRLLKNVMPRSLTAVAGNATPDAAQLIRISAGHTEILDILNSIVLDDDRYFEHADEYTPDQKYTLTQHIAAYWQ